ncbi:MAG: ArsR/SmtB family transcription factor [Verrucomicrobiia bacterium]
MSDFKRKKYEQHARIFKALAHPARVFIVDELSRGERCVCELTKMLKVKMPTVSRHLSVLKNAGIIEEEKRGLNIFYRIKTPCVINFFRCVIEVQKQSLKGLRMF